MLKIQHSNFAIQVEDLLVDDHIIASTVSTSMNNLFVIFIVLAGIFGNKIVLGETIYNELTGFSINLYKKLIEEYDGNLVHSPYSIANILGLMSLGSEGSTKTQIISALKVEFSDQEIKDKFKEAEKSLKDAQLITIETANKAYLADGFAIKPEFLKTAVDDFNAGAENVNFSEPKKAAETINSWVEKQTHSKIKKIVCGKTLSDLTRLVLVNTLYFKGKWDHPFRQYATSKKDFHNTKSDIVQVDMMKTSGQFNMDRDSALGVTMLSLPYENTKAELVIALPDEIEGLKSLKTNVEKLRENLNFTKTYVKVSLPKFRVESTIDMIPALKKLGITNLFAGADLSGITKEPLVVTSITQKTFIDVNEEGTEAAAATSMVADNRIEIPNNPNTPVFNVDRPFFFGLYYDDIELLSGSVEKL